MSSLVSASYSQDKTELVKLSDYFSKYYQYADKEKMDEILTADFRYFTNVKCYYKNCDTGTGKTDYIEGVLFERSEKGFTVESITMEHIPSLKNSEENKISFYCLLTTKAKGSKYRFRSIIEYYFRQEKNDWKIFKIENRLIDD